MTTAKWTFRIAGVWGIVVLLPMLFLERQLGLQYPPRITHPEFFYGFVCVALAWQVAFLIISTDPAKYRPLIPACMLEKFAFVAAVAFLWMAGRTPDAMLFGAAVDLLLGIAFTAVYFGSSAESPSLPRPEFARPASIQGNQTPGRHIH